MTDSILIKVHKQLKQEIIEGKYFPNEKLTENSLASKYETSRNTIRNVLSLLETEGLVVIEPNKGAKVAAIDLEDIINILELRAEVEAYITRETTPLLTDQDIQKMQKIFNEMKQEIKTNNYEEHPQLNIDFHNVIYDKAKNKIAVDLIRDLKTRLASYNFKIILIPGRSETTLQEHEAVLQAITNKDAELASRKIKEHIYSVRDTIIQYNRLLLNN